MGDGLRLADVDAGVRATLAAYVHALDDGRTDDLVATFTPDATVDLGAQGVHRGHDAIRAAYAAWVPCRPQRHLVLNTRLREWDQEQARAVSDVVFLAQGREGWSVQLVGRYDDVLHRHGDTWLLHHRTASFETSVGS